MKELQRFWSVIVEMLLAPGVNSHWRYRTGGEKIGKGEILRMHEAKLAMELALEPTLGPAGPVTIDFDTLDKSRYYFTFSPRKNPVLEAMESNEANLRGKREDF